MRACEKDLTFGAAEVGSCLFAQSLARISLALGWLLFPLDVGATGGEEDRTRGRVRTQDLIKPRLVWTAEVAIGTSGSM